MIDLDKVVKDVQGTFGKDKSLANKISRGDSISKPTEDAHFVCWKDSPWEMLTGIKGCPFGRVVQVAGRPDSGKSSMASKFMTNAQEQGVTVILWDSENKFSVKRFDDHFGGNSSDLLIVPSRMILEGGDIVERYVHAIKEQNPTEKIFIVWDSVGGTQAKNEEEGSLMESKQMAAHSKENGQVLRAFIRLMEKYKNKETGEETIGVFLVNQVYANIGAPGQKESGGQKVEFFSSIILQLTRKGDITKTRNKLKRKTGIITRAKVKKNHMFDGEDSIAELDLAVTAGGIQSILDKTIMEKEGWDDFSGEEGS